MPAAARWAHRPAQAKLVLPRSPKIIHVGGWEHGHAHRAAGCKQRRQRDGTANLSVNTVGQAFGAVITSSGLGLLAANCIFDAIECQVAGRASIMVSSYSVATAWQRTARPSTPCPPRRRSGRTAAGFDRHITRERPPCAEPYRRASVRRARLRLPRPVAGHSTRPCAYPVRR